MMAPRRDMEGGRVPTIDEDRHDDGDVGQMGAAIIGGVERVDVARLHAPPVHGHAAGARAAPAQDGADAVAHAAQMHRHMRRIGDQIACRVEQGAGEIEPLADIDRGRAVLERGAHFLRDRHEQPAHHFEPHGIDSVRVRRLGRGARLVAREDEIADGIDPRAPAGLHDGGRDRIDDERGAVYFAVAIEAGAVMHRRGAAAAIDLRQGLRSLFGEGGEAVHRLLRGGDRLHPGHVDEDRALPFKTEAGAMLGEEIGAHRRQVGERHVEQAVGAVIAQPQQRFGPVRLRQVGAGIGRERFERLVELRHAVVAKAQRQRPFPHRPPIGQAHAISGQDAAQRMDHHPVHAQRVGDQAGMLPPGPAEAGEGVARHVMAARDRDALDRIGHVGDRHGDEAFGRLPRGHGAAGLRLHLRADRREALRHRVPIERLVAIGAEQAGEEIGLDLAQHHIAIGDGERTAAPVAGGSRHRAGAFRADAETPVDEGADGAAARRDRVDPHHRRAQPDAGHPRFIVALIAAGIMGHIGRGAAHVEADHFAKARLFGRAREADDAARRPGQHRILAAEQRARGQPAIGLHEQHVRIRAQRGAQAIDIGAQDRREIGVGQRRIAAPDKFDERGDIMAGADLGEAHLGGDPRQRLFMRGMPVAVHQQDRDRTQPPVEGGLQRRARRRFVQGEAHRAVRAHPLVDLDDIGMERIGQADLPREQVGALLRADADGVAKAARHRQQHRLALAFQQGIGGDGGADAQRAGRDGTGADAGQAAHRFDRGVGIAFGVAGQQLGGVKLPIGVARDHIGESAAAIDPEMPGHERPDGGADRGWQERAPFRAQGGGMRNGCSPWMPFRTPTLIPGGREVTGAGRNERPGPVPPHASEFRDDAGHRTDRAEIAQRVGLNAQADVAALGRTAHVGGREFDARAIGGAVEIRAVRAERVEIDPLIADLAEDQAVLARLDPGAARDAIFPIDVARHALGRGAFHADDDGTGDIIVHAGDAFDHAALIACGRNAFLAGFAVEIMHAAHDADIGFEATGGAGVVRRAALGHRGGGNQGRGSGCRKKQCLHGVDPLICCGCLRRCGPAGPAVWRCKRPERQEEK